MNLGKRFWGSFKLRSFELKDSTFEEKKFVSQIFDTN